MRDYAVLADLKAKASFHIEKAFDRGYDQGYQDGKLDGKAEKIEELEKQFDDEKKDEYDRGFKEGKGDAEDDMYKYYNKHFNDVVHSSNDDAYQRGYKDGMQNPSSIGYQHGYEAGLQHGQELRVKEAECAEACGMKRAWEAARKIVLIKENGGIPLSDLNEIFGAVNVLKVFSASDAIEKIDAWEKKQEQTKKNCKNCAHRISEKSNEKFFKCDAKGNCVNHEQWTPKQDAPEMNVESIENRDKIVKAIAGLLAAYGDQIWDVAADMQKNP